MYIFRRNLARFSLHKLTSASRIDTSVLFFQLLLLEFFRFSKATMKKKTPLMFPQYVFPLRSLFTLLSPNLGVLLALLIFDCEAVIGVIGISWSRRSSSSASSSSLFSSALIFVGNGVPLLFPIDRTVRGPGVAKFVSSVYEHKLSFFWFNFHLPHNSQIHNEQRVQIISEMTLRCVHNRASRFSRLGTETPRLSV